MAASPLRPKFAPRLAIFPPQNIDIVLLNNCSYSRSTSQFKSNKLIICDVNKDQTCKFIYIVVFYSVINKDKT